MFSKHIFLLKQNAARCIALCATLCSALFFTGCQDPIFWNVRQEVKLEKAEILGDIFSIVRFGDRLFVANGNIYSKPKNADRHGAWSKMGSPGGHVLKVAADETYLYALSFTFEEDDSEGEMAVASKRLYYSSDGNTWNPVSLSLGRGHDEVAHLFCTNAPQADHRSAYINRNGTVYELNGASATSVSASSGTRSCVYAGGVKFFNAEAACTNETDSAAATVIYYSSGSDLKRCGTDGSSGETTIANSPRSTIYGIAVMKDSVFVTSAVGTVLVSRDSGSEIQFENLQSTMSTLYESRACLAVDPSQNAHDTAVYAGLCVEGTGSNSALFTHEGLWSYYPSRGKWNIE